MKEIKGEMILCEETELDCTFNEENAIAAFSKFQLFSDRHLRGNKNHQQKGTSNRFSLIDDRHLLEN